MGGGDLNLKKSWHPQTLRNVEKVWKAEQKAEAESKKIEQLQRELGEEREREEMQRYAIDQGITKKKSDRLEWMYSAPGQSGVNHEEYLLGKSIDKAVDPLAVNDEKNTEAPGASFMDDAPNTSSDFATKIRDDPLFMIKKKENEKKKELLKNPVRMKQLQQMLKAGLGDKAAKKAKKEKKKRKKEKRKKHSSEEHKSKENRKASSHDQKKRSKDFESSEDSSTQANGLSDNHQKKYHSSRYPEQPENKQSPDMVQRKRRRSSNSPERDSKDHRNNLNSNRSHRNRSPSESSSPSPRKQRRDHYSPHKHSKEDHRNHRSGDSQDNDSHTRSGRHRSRSQSPHSFTRNSRRENPPLESQSTSRKTKHKGSSSTRKMTDEEREKKLAEMMDNAKWRDEQRGNNVKRYKKEEEAEAKEVAKNNEKGASFVQPLKVQTFTSSTASVENRIKRNIHQLQRTPAALEKFMKK